MPRHSYDNIISNNVIILEFLSAQFVHPDTLQLTTSSFFNLSLNIKITNANKLLVDFSF